MRSRPSITRPSCMIFGPQRRAAALHGGGNDQPVEYRETVTFGKLQARGMGFDIQRKDDGAKIAQRRKRFTQLGPGQAKLASRDVRELVQALHADCTSAGQQLFGFRGSRIGTESVDENIRVQKLVRLYRHLALASSRSNFHPAGSGRRSARIRSKARSRLRSSSTSKARSPATLILISSPSFRPKASTTAEGKRTARLFPILQSA